MKKPVVKGLGPLPAALFWLGLWSLLSLAVAKPLLLPTPWAVLERLWQLAGSAGFWLTVLRTLSRILLGLVTAVPAGLLLAALGHRFAPVRAVFQPLMSVIQSTPVASFILLLLVWLDRDTLPSAVVFLMVTPLLWANTSAGIDAADPQQLEMAALFRLPRRRILRHIYIPAATPYVLAGLRSALGLAWKSGVAAEVLTVPKNSIGQKLYESKLYLETTDLFAWTVAVILCSLAIEKLLAAALRARENRRAAP